MKPICTLAFASLVAMASLSFGVAGNEVGKIKSTAVKGFAVVELFTSEGCSSCPPADEAAIELAKEFPGNVYFLGFHVDYWDYIGWKDVFADASYTSRQREYASALHLDGIYTPQVVVNGKKELVGSKESQLRAIIQQELNEPASSVIELTAKSSAGNTIAATYKATTTGKSLLHIALVQLKATSRVKRGENSGHQLNHINVVRQFKTIEINKQANATVEFTLPQGLTAGDVKLIAYVQDKNSGKISGAGEAVAR